MKGPHIFTNGKLIFLTPLRKAKNLPLSRNRAVNCDLSDLFKND